MSRSPRLALVVPTVELGAYWKPVLDDLATRCEEVRLFTAMPWRGIREEELHPAGRVTVVGEKRRVTTSGDRESDYGGGVMVLSPAITSALWRFRPDVVVTSGFSLWTMLVLALRPLARWRVVLLWEGSSPRVDFRDDPRRTIQRRRVALAADAIVTNSPGGRDYLVDHVGIPAGRVEQVPYMVPDPTTLAGGTPPSPGPKGTVTVLSVGRWEPRKGVLTLLEVIAGLDEDLRRRVRVRLVGAGPEADAIQRLVADAGMEDMVELVGWVPYEELGAQMAAADLLAFMTHEDTWGMVALEAMAVGTAVLCSRWAGAHGLVDPELIVDPHDVEGTREALARLLQDPERITALGARAAERMAGHRPSHAAGRLYDAARRAADPRT